jgi:hypothetical protein
MRLHHCPLSPHMPQREHRIGDCHAVLCMGPTLPLINGSHSINNDIGFKTFV